MKIIEGGVTAAKGFEAASTAAKIKYQDRTDMAMIYSQVPCECAGTFTTNVVKAACVKWDQQVVKSGAKAQAVIVNSGIDDHSLCFRTALYNLLIPFYACCLYNVCSKCSCTFTWNLAVDHCHVGSVLIFDLCCC